MEQMVVGQAVQEALQAQKLSMKNCKNRRALMSSPQTTQTGLLKRGLIWNLLRELLTNRRRVLEKGKRKEKEAVMKMIIKHGKMMTMMMRRTTTMARRKAKRTKAAYGLHLVHKERCETVI